MGGQHLEEITIPQFGLGGFEMLRPRKVKLGQAKLREIEAQEVG
jgi:hypothetical protein